METINGTGLRRENFEMLEERIESLVQTISNLANNSDVRLFEKDKIVQKIPALGGTPQIILIVAGWRTGSTFLSELVSSNLKNMRYLIYEPLMSNFRVNLIRKEEKVKEALYSSYLQKLNYFFAFQSWTLLPRDFLIDGCRSLIWAVRLGG